MGIEELDDEDEMGEEEEEDGEEEDDDMDDSEEGMISGMATGENSPGAMDSGDDDDVQEVKEDSSDSDVMEVDQEDPLSKTLSSNTMVRSNLGNIPKLPLPPNLQALITKNAEKSSAVTSTEVKKPQVVTIDDPKALQALATSAAKSKARAEKDKVTIIDTAQILAGRSSSSVTITPAAKFGGGQSQTTTLPSTLASSLAASGVTISSKTTQNKVSSPRVPETSP